MPSIKISQLNQAVKNVTAAKQSQNFPPLDAETRSHVDTACAAFHLMRKPQTMRAYACFETGNIRPTRINGRLAWAVADIRRLLSAGT